MHPLLRAGRWPLYNMRDANGERVSVIINREQFVLWPRGARPSLGCELPGTRTDMAHIQTRRYESRLCESALQHRHFGQS